jgi:hypothetical protein
MKSALRRRWGNWWRVHQILAASVKNHKPMRNHRPDCEIGTTVILSFASQFGNVGACCWAVGLERPPSVHQPGYKCYTWSNRCSLAAQSGSDSGTHNIQGEIEVTSVRSCCCHCFFGFLVLHPGTYAYPRYPGTLITRVPSTIVPDSSLFGAPKKFKRRDLCY